MELLGKFVFYVIIVYIIYKILDRLIRIPRVGNYKDRFILITGCDSGFGKAAAKRLDALGCNVFAGCLTESGETELRKLCSGRLRAFSLDVSKKESVRRALEFVSANLPPGKGLWGVLNNAGVLTSMGSPDWLHVDDYKRQCEVNLWGVIDVTLTFLSLVKRAKGRIVNTSSLMGRFCYPGILPYAISKYGVEAFTDGIRRVTYAFGCKASLIEPGAFKTNINNAFKELSTRAWENTSQEIQTEYGEELARHIIEKQTEALFASCSEDIEQVVDAYEHALLARFPQARYLVGFDAKYVFYPVMSMPEWFQDWILRRQSDAPLPRAA